MTVVLFSIFFSTQLEQLTKSNFKIVFNVTLLMQGIKSFIFQPHFHARRSRDL